MSEKIKEIIKKIEFYNGKFPTEELQILIDNQGEATSHLLDVIRDSEKCFEILWEEKDYIMPFYALFLLAQFKEKKAYPLIFNLFTFDAKKVDSVFGEFVTEDLGRVLASVCDGNTGYINKLIEDETVFKYVRISALNSWICLLKTGAKSREEVISYHQSLFLKDWKNKVDIHTALAGNCLDVKANELIPQVQKSFENDQVNLQMYGDWDEFLELYNDRTKDFYYENMKLYDLVTDTIVEMNWWAYFQEEETDTVTFDELFEVINTKTSKENQYGKKTKPKESIIWNSIRDGTFIREIPKVGINEPCFCGSGIKYKKCCINL
jgi:hypothetical protein